MMISKEVLLCVSLILDTFTLLIIFELNSELKMADSSFFFFI